MDKSFNKVIKSHLILSVLSVFAVVLLMTGVTYALFQIEDKNAENQTISVGTLDANLSSTSGTITLSDIYPTKMSELPASNPKYSFTLTNTGTYGINYTVYLSDNTDNFLSSNPTYSSYKKLSTNYYKYIDYRMDGANTAKNLAQIFDMSTKKMFLKSGYLEAGASETHTIEFWMDNGDTNTVGAPNDIIGSILALNINLEGTVGKQSITDKIIKNVKTGTPDFNTIATTDDGLYSMQDDYGTSYYYYRGAVVTNYVKFAEKYWRIIRINGDGSFRIIYDGTKPHANGENSTDRFVETGPFNSLYGDNAYVGYMYGTAGSTSYSDTHTNSNSSDIKLYLENWYKLNIVDKGYSSAVADTIFCGDRTVNQLDAGYETGDGTGITKTSYGRYRLFTNKSPMLICPQKNDAYTMDDKVNGNGYLTYPVGLITADEISLAGGKYYSSDGLANNVHYYLYKGTPIWSMSPCNFGSNRARVFNIDENGALRSSYVHDTSIGIAPVINLTAEYVSTMHGTGTMTDPYTAE